MNCVPAGFKESRDSGSRGDRGVVLIYFAMTLLVLIVMCGFAIDIGNWYYHMSKLQKAADAAALGGAIYLPADVARAGTTATEVATENGYVVSPRVTLALSEPAPTQLKVTLSETVDNFFAQLIGLNTQKLTRSATAEFEQPVKMGSPASIFGNEPLGPKDGTQKWSNVATFQPNMWANVFGPATPKSNGDAVQAFQCSTANDGCPIPNNNLDYDPQGYLYSVSVDPLKQPPGTKLAIEVYDPAFVAVGDHCNGANMQNTAIPPKTELNQYTTLPDAPARYVWGDSSNNSTNTDGKFCTGDQPSGATPPLTTYVVHANTDPLAGAANPVLSDTGCKGVQFPGRNVADVPAALTGLPLPDAKYDDYLSQVFRQWIPVCVFDPSLEPAPSYLIQIRTNLPLGTMTGPGDQTTSTGSGNNRFAIRTAWVTPAVPNATFTPNTPDTSPTSWSSSDGLAVYGQAKMGLYANAAGPPAPIPNFYMARILPGATGQTLRVRLWDVGDCGGCTSQPQLTFLDNTGATIPQCATRVPDAVVSFTSQSPCSFPAQFNGLWLTIDIPIPSGWTCTVADPNDCWIKMKYQITTPGAALNDTTTWSAQLLGNPVRLVK